MAAALADRLGEMFLGVAEVGDQAIVAFGLLDRREALALDVFHQGDFEGVLVGQVADDDRHFMQLRALGRTPTPLARDDLVAVGSVGGAPDEDRLENALLADRLGQGLDGLGVKPAPRLELSGTQRLDRHGARRAGALVGGGLRGVVAEE